MYSPTRIKPIPILPPSPIISISTPHHYSCKSCRTHLFTSSQLDPHSQHSNYKFKKENSEIYYSTLNSTCNTLFLKNFPHWLGNMKDNEGRIYCPNLNCEVKLGKWKWSGDCCSCGKWVVPSVKISKRKLDVSVWRVKKLRAKRRGGRQIVRQCKD